MIHNDIMANFRLHILLLLTLLLQSCIKEQIDIPVTEIQTSTSQELRNVFFLNDSVGYACGGARYEIGVLLKTTNGGRSWSTADSIMPKRAYAIHFFNEKRGYVTGYDSWLSFTDDSAKTFFTYTMPAYLPTIDMKFFDEQHGVMVGGNGYTTGTIYTTQNGGGSWKEQLVSQNLQATEWLSQNKVLAVGYGILYISNDAGETWQAHNDVEGDFFKDISFPNSQTGYIVGWQGSILKTTDGGHSWQKQQAANQGFQPQVKLEAVDFIDENTGAIVGSNGTVYITNNGGRQWKKVKAFTNLNLFDVHIFSDKSAIVCGEGGQVFLLQLP